MTSGEEIDIFAYMSQPNVQGWFKIWSNIVCYVVACGKYHTMVLTEEGMLYTCGNNDFGQLGHEGPRTKLRT